MACRFEMDCHNLVEEFLHLGKLEKKLRACSQAPRDRLVPVPLQSCRSSLRCDADMDQALHEHNFVLKESNSAINSRWFYWFSDCIREDLLDVQAIHACQIGRGKLPTKDQKRLPLLGTKLFFKQILGQFTDPLFSLYRCRARTWKYKLRGDLLTSSASGWGWGKKNVCARPFWGNCPPTPPLRQHFALSEKKVLMLA